jgi:hypothetical protein
VQQCSGQVDDRSAGGDHHDHEHECRLGKVAAFQIMQGSVRTAVSHQDHQQHRRPEAEHHFYFAQQVPESCMVGLGMGQRLEVVCAEGVQKRDREDRDGSNLNHSRGGHSSPRDQGELGRRAATAAIPGLSSRGRAGVRALE